MAVAPGCEEHVTYLMENAADIQDLVGKKPASVSTKAVKILRMLGVEEIDAPEEPTPVTEHGGVVLEAEPRGPPEEMGAAVLSEPAMAGEPVDLLGGYSDPAPATTIQTPVSVEASPEAVPSGPGGSMFGNLAMKTNPPPAAESTPLEASLLGVMPSQQNGSQTVSAELGGLLPPEPANMLLPPDNDHEAPVNATVDHFANMDLMGQSDTAAMTAPTPQTPMPPPMEEAMPTAMSAAMPGGMPGAMPGAMPGGMPGAMPGGMPGAMPGGMPGAMPGGMPGAMPGANPVREPTSGEQRCPNISCMLFLFLRSRPCNIRT